MVQSVSRNSRSEACLIGCWLSAKGTAAELVVEAIDHLLSWCAGNGNEAGDADEAGDQQAGDEQVQDRQTASLSKQYGLVDGDVVSATAAYCNERKLAAKTVSVSICTRSAALHRGCVCNF